MLHGRILTKCRSRVFSYLRIFLGSVLVAASFTYFVYREISLGFRLSPSYEYVKSAVRFNSSIYAVYLTNGSESDYGLQPRRGDAPYRKTLCNE